MKDNYDLSWTEQFGTDQLLTKLDEAALELDILKLKYKELQREANMYEKLYMELWKKIGSMGL